MKIVVVVMMTFMPLLLNAQGFPSGDPQQMQAMMEKAQQVQACMQNIDQSKMQGFQKKGQKMAAEIKTLCAAGKRSEALEKAISYGQEMANEPSIQALRQCSEIMQGFVPGIMKLAEPYLTENSDVHICD